ncbi:LysR family transcriptional regulator [Streptacidiphilus sp. ASG 303]|uniref:LysR family transcriptional regulator n=1 Tax=Streptomycetaceae TaxID=2062 RepID=UPI001E489FBA|nr:LysR family transcriptional regulator [Streptacidiphilus sp. ASG 303]MCD0481392.1 LysR family transcriptional regulator [Streptacidiphilus sp. ASG 303]
MHPRTDPRLLRAFTAAAETLHFTQAAARLHVAQQALSRDIRTLERDLGCDLFVRTTRRVQLTADGERLLPYARRVLAACDELAAAFAPAARPLLVDVGAERTTPARVLAAAREAAPETELVARYSSGLTGAADAILAGRLDVAFGRAAGLAPAVRSRLAHCPVRYEPMAVLLPADHPLAARREVPLSALTGEALYAAAGNPATAEWTDLARRLLDGRGVDLVAPFPGIDGAREFTRLVGKHRWSVLASTDFGEVPGFVLRPLTDPVPLSPVAMVWRRGLRHPGLDALLSAVRELAGAAGWLERPPGSWLPAADARLMAAPSSG